MEKVAIVGGSIAGCAMAVALSRLGFDVSIYERSPNGLSDRGAGICIPEELRDALVQQDLFDQGTQHLAISSRQFVISDKGREAHVIWQQPINAMAHNWSEIYTQLYKRLSDEIYNTGVSVEAIEQDEKRVCLTLSTGKTVQADWLFCCDGVNSVARELLFAEAKLEAASYIAWRGVLAKSKVVEPGFYEQMNYFCYEQGHVVTYYIPNEKGKFELNWVAYQQVSEEQKYKLLTDENGFSHSTSLAKNKLTSWHREELAKLANKLPEMFAQTVMATEQPFIQNIFDVRVPALRRGRVCLSGDAGFISRPHTAGGATKALQSALVLQQALNSCDNNLDQAVSVWVEKQFAMEEKLYQLGQVFGRELVTDSPDWLQMDQVKMDGWWSGILQGRNWYAAKSKT